MQHDQSCIAALQMQIWYILLAYVPKAFFAAPKGTEDCRGQSLSWSSPVRGVSRL